MKNFFILPLLFICNIAYCQTSSTLSLPSAVIINGVPHEGINYYSCSDSVTLVLYAPNKTSAFVIGDFTGSNWAPQPQYQMYRTPDGNYYWITLHGLISGTQYGFQYLVDNSIYIADPYSEEILDGNNDKYIPAATYPNLKAYPSNSNVSISKNGLIGVLQTCATQYTWKITNFTPPDKKNLMIEEVLVRDFAAVDGNGNFKLLTDSINYFKNLGINAIELMPISEFSGNDSWGYNPNFYCALDKAYGTKSMYKTFIDSCHANGIAVIMDVVYNQIDDNNDQVPEARLYWDATNKRPAANNPWLNIAAPHPYSVFQDLNHTSAATQYWVERSLSYWLTEFHIDGFRFDLAKGFTQTCSQTSAMCSSASTSIENYDASRVANIERYYTYLQNNHPGSVMPYMILEFLGTQDQNNPGSEEAAYANFGFMLWNDVNNNGNSAFNQCTMGYNTNSNLSKVVYNSGEESFSIPASVGYTASHDDERLMYNNETYGNGSSVKSISGSNGGLQREAAAASLLFTIPGPHMFYQFAERGYDISINTNNRTGYKPPHWEYLTTDANAATRKALVNVYSQLIKLRLSNPDVFNNTTFSYDLYDNGGLFRRFQIASPSSSGISVTVLANFDITAQTRTVNFQTAGNWYNYQSNGTGSGLNGSTGVTFNLSSTSQSVTLQPGEYHVYVSKPSPAPVITSSGNATGAVGSAFSYNITSSNSPTSYNATNLPAGLNVNTSTGVISGTPTSAGTYNVTISASNANGTGSAIMAITITANIVVYFENTTGWPQPNVYCWSPTPSSYANCLAWPGTAMTKVAGCGNWWTYTFTGVTATNLIFNDGGNNQTADLNLSSAGIYNFSWSTKSWLTGSPTCSNTPSSITVYFSNTGNWTKPRIYCWSPTPSSYNNCPSWPGSYMSKVQNCGTWWTYTFTGVTATNLIFNDGGSNQTANLSLGSSGTYNYSWSSRTWASGIPSCSASRPSFDLVDNTIEATAIPNPVVNKNLQLEIQTGITGNANIRIVDLAGRVLQQVNKVMVKSGNNLISLSLQKNLPGYYIAIIEQGGYSTHVKFVLD